MGEIFHNKAFKGSAQGGTNKVFYEGEGGCGLIQREMTRKNVVRRWR